MKVHLQNKPSDNLVSSLANLIDILKVKVTALSLKSVKSHPDYPRTGLPAEAYNGAGRNPHLFRSSLRKFRPKPAVAP